MKPKIQKRNAVDDTCAATTVIELSLPELWWGTLLRQGSGWWWANVSTDRLVPVTVPD